MPIDTQEVLQAAEREEVASKHPDSGAIAMPRAEARAGAGVAAFANAFLVAFACEALFTIAGSLIGPRPEWLLTARILFTTLVTLASLPLFVLLGIHPGLRWRIFLPPCLLLSWIAMGAMPLPIAFSASDAGLITGVLEAAIAGVAFMLCRSRNGGTGWLLDKAALSGSAFSGRTAVAFTALNLLVILPASLLYLAVAAAAGVAHLTDGFVAIRADGIHLSHREYRRDDQTIHLVAMMHIGDPAFYEELMESLASLGAITLAEGVSDDSGLLSGSMSYGNVAAGLGLVEQPELRAGGGQLRYADVDVSEFSPETLVLLHSVGKIFASETLQEGLMAYVELSRMDALTAERTLAVLKHDLIELRNDHLLVEIEMALRDHDVVVVPWGALHLPGIEQQVRGMGFVQQAERDRRVVSW